MTKNLNTTLLSFAMLLLLPLASSAQLPKPTYGWNLGNTMEPPKGIGTWGGTPTRALINSVAKAGFNVVRIPCAWNCHADPTTHQIDPAYMASVKEVVDWCYANNLTVIINDHWDGGWLEKNITGTVNPMINDKMKAYWTQIAASFAPYNGRLLFAAANEPGVDNAAKMAELLTYYQTFVDAVRSTGGNNKSRWLVLQGANTDINKTDRLTNTLPNDPTPRRLIVEVHYYSPYQFCLMGKDASWGKMAYFWGLPYHSTTMPWRNATRDEEATLNSQLQKMNAKFVRKDIPVILGEFRADRRKEVADLQGAYWNLHLASVTYYDKCVVDFANKNGIAPIFWDTPNALFDFKTGAVLDPDGVRALTGGPALPPPPTVAATSAVSGNG